MTREQYAKLTDEDVQIKIAELCDWKQCSLTLNGLGGYPPECNPIPDCRVNNSGQWRKLPDYLNDLNAMHEVEQILVTHVDAHCLTRFTHMLGLVVTGRSCIPIGRDAYNATAAQRAEAFVLTMEAA